MENIYDFLEELEIFLTQKAKDEIWLYSGHTRYGSILIKNSINNKRIMLKPSDSIHAIGASRIEDFIAKTPTYKGYNVDNYIFIANIFNVISNRIAKTNKQITLVSVDIDNKQIQINGSMNIDLNILNVFIEFADFKKFSISYDFEGLLRRQGFNKKEEITITPIEERTASPTVFFSYSWDNEDHKLWVLRLAAELIRNGIEVLIDEWNLDKYNNDLHFFMESGIRSSEKVIMICTPEYAEKANERKGGVGVENTIITGEFYDKSKDNKFIPIVRKYEKKLSDSLPSFLKTKYSIDFSKDPEFRSKLEELERKILNIPRFKKPELGTLPKLTSHEI
jgi:hypothetical protein